MLKSLQFIICSKIKKVNEVPRTEKQIETIITNLIYSVLLRADCFLIPDLVLFRTMQTVICGGAELIHIRILDYGFQIRNTSKCFVLLPGLIDSFYFYF